MKAASWRGSRFSRRRSALSPVRGLFFARFVCYGTSGSGRCLRPFCVAGVFYCALLPLPPLLLSCNPENAVFLPFSFFFSPVRLFLAVLAALWCLSSPAFAAVGLYTVFFAVGHVDFRFHELVSTKNHSRSNLPNKKGFIFVQLACNKFFHGEVENQTSFTAVRQFNMLHLHKGILIPPNIRFPAMTAKRKGCV